MNIAMVMKESHISVSVREGQCRMVYYDWVPQVTQGKSLKSGLVLCLHGLTGSERFFDESSFISSESPEKSLFRMK